jgi:membrane protein required for colicin V production
MNFIDFLLIFAVAIFSYIGSGRGFLHEAVTVIVWLLSLLAAWHFAHLVEPYLGGLLAEAAVRTWSSRFIALLIALFILSAIGKAVLHYVKLSVDKGVDRGLGITLGTIRGVMVIGVIVLLGQLLRLDGEGWWRRSALMPYGESVANGVRVLVGESTVHRKRVANAR